MIRRLLWSLMVICLAMGSAVFADNIIDTPESIAWDSVYNRYLVSCYGSGRVIAVDTSGEQTIFASGMGHCLGNQIVGDTLFVSASTSVKGFDLETGTNVWTWTAPSGSAVDGLAADTSGYLYVTSPGYRTIYRIDLTTGTSDVLTSELPTSPQDITFDKYHNRLLVCSYQTVAPITAVSLPDGVQTQLAVAPYGNQDGIAHDEHGNTYVGCASGIVLMWDSAFTDPPRVVISGSFWVAGLDYNDRDDIIAVPDFYGDQMLLFPMFRPELQYLRGTIDDSSGDGDGHAEPGETFAFLPTVINDGWATTNIEGQLVSLDPFITVTNSDVLFPDMEGDGAIASALTPFELTVDGACPDPHIAKLELTITAAGKYPFVDTFMVYSGNTFGIEDDVENGEGLWTLSSSGADFVNQWHLETYRQHSGATAWKAGGIGIEDYADFSDSRLVSPPFLLPPNANLTFWHWIAAQEAEEAGRAWDGAAVYLSTGDGTWNQIAPTDGYPYSIYENPESPFEPNTPCYSGTSDWTQAEFDLSAYSGVVQLMFRFGSDGFMTAEGWYIDDIAVIYTGCCGTYTGGYTGNTDCDTDGKRNLADITKLIDRVYLSKTPLCCEENGNVDGDSEGKFTLADITKLIDHVYLSKQMTALCQ